MNSTLHEKIEKLHLKIAIFISYFSTLMVLAICIDVLLRYLFNISFNALTELEWYFFSVVFLLGLSYTFRNDRHVRVDVFYGNFSEKNKNLVNKIGTIIFLIPFCLIIIFYSSKFTYNAWLINESSAEAGGLPFRFLVKALIPIGYIMLLTQAILFLFTKTESKK